MSGRSAYVRKAKTQYKEKGHAGQAIVPHYAHPQHIVYAPVIQPPPIAQPVQPQYPPRHESQPFTHQNGFEYVPRPIQRRSSSAQASTPMSVSSWPGSDQSVHHPEPRSYHQAQPSYHRSDTSASAYQRPPPPTSAGPSAIEKSSFRSFMDSKSEAIRNKLSSTFSAKTSDDGSNDGRRPESRQTRGIGSLAYELPATPMLEPLPARPRTQARMQPGVPLQPGVGHDLGVRGLEHVTSVVLRWTGGRRPPEPWTKLRKDPELWDPTADTLVFFGHETAQAPRPPPSFRVNSSILDNTRSEYLIMILREGWKFHHVYNLPASPASPLPSNNSFSPTPRDVQSSASTYESDRYSAPRRPKPPQAINSLSPRPQPTPPMSDGREHDETPVIHEIYLEPPQEASTLDILRHHLTSRNFFAMLLNKSLVGLNLFQALLDLHERVRLYMPDEVDSVGLIVDYLETNHLSDVRDNPASAAGLLAWSENDKVRWHAGWREAFVHCVGMYSRLSVLPEYRDVSPITRALLERAHLEQQVRTQLAEERLERFDFEDVWPVMSAQAPPARSSFDRFQKFLNKFYSSVYWSWPPRTSSNPDAAWLTREIAGRLQSDFSALYDYFVDRDVQWDDDEMRSDRKWKIISRSKKSAFRADSDDLPMTDFLTGFDSRHNFPHIPHPYPLLPASIPVQYHVKQGFFGGKKTRGMDEKATERRIALAYSEATNIFVLGSDFAANDLVDAFLRFEKTDQVGEIDPVDARKGRWILLYCILQVLATVSVDTPGLRYKDDVPYFLNPPLQGSPPWKGPRDPADSEASHYVSHCWTAPKQWAGEFNVDKTSLSNHRQLVIPPADGLDDGFGRDSPASSGHRGGAGESRERVRGDQRSRDDHSREASVRAERIRDNRSRDASLHHERAAAAAAAAAREERAREERLREEHREQPRARDDRVREERRDDRPSPRVDRSRAGSVGDEHIHSAEHVRIARVERVLNQGIPKGWVPSNGAFLDDTPSPANASPRNTASPDGRIKDWPIQGQRRGDQGHPQREVAPSDFVPPEGW